MGQRRRQRQRIRAARAGGQHQVTGGEAVQPAADGPADLGHRPSEGRLVGDCPRRPRWQARREHAPTPEHPLIVILVDEVAFLTAYQPDKQLRDRVKAALATLTTQGRAVGFSVVVAGPAAVPIFWTLTAS